MQKHTEIWISDARPDGTASLAKQRYINGEKHGELFRMAVAPGDIDRVIDVVCNKDMPQPKTPFTAAFFSEEEEQGEKHPIVNLRKAWGTEENVAAYKTKQAAAMEAFAATHDAAMPRTVQ